MRKPDRAKKPIQICCITLPHEQLSSYPDIGDWKCNHDGSPAFIASADTGNDISNAAILLHEFVEAVLCWLHDVSEREVSAFDENFFKEKAQGVEHLYGEPGADPSAPYHSEHMIATRFESQFIEACGLSWTKHEENCERIYA
jgi:hypothetical protein